MEAPEDTDSSSDVWDVRHIQLQPVDSRRIMWIRDMLEVTIPIMETASHPGKIITNLNGENASYSAVLKTGDTIELRWKEN